MSSLCVIRAYTLRNDLYTSHFYESGADDVIFPDFEYDDTDYCNVTIYVEPEFYDSLVRLVEYDGQFLMYYKAIHPAREYEYGDR